MKLTYVILIYESIFSIKKGLNSLNILHSVSHKSFTIHYDLRGEGELKLILTYLSCTKYNELTYLIQMYKSIFSIHNHTKYF